MNKVKAKQKPEITNPRTEKTQTKSRKTRLAQPHPKHTTETSDISRSNKHVSGKPRSGYRIMGNDLIGNFCPDGVRSRYPKPVNFQMGVWGTYADM
jgi:hypothetical protein